MKIELSTYRQILRLCAKAGKKYEDPNDLCFAMFGILLSPSDFARAGYGATLPAIARTCFERPSIAGDARDSAIARTTAAFAVMRRLRDLERSGGAARLREERREALTRVATVAETVEEAVVGKEKKKGSGEEEEEGQAAAAAADASEEAEDGEESEGEEGEEGDEAWVGGATLFIEGFGGRNLKKIMRHVVVPREEEAFPPYRYLLPPEPIYVMRHRSDFSFSLMRDAVICFAAAGPGANAAAAPPVSLSAAIEALAEERLAAKVATAVGGDTVKGQASGGDGAATPVVPSRAELLASCPKTPEELQAALRRVPSRTVTRTDFMEVEVCTQYVGVVPHTSSSSSSSSSSASSPSSSSSGSPKEMHLFMYYIFMRNKGPAANPKMWHAQVVSQHFAVFDPARGTVCESTRPGTVGDMPLLSPGGSYVCEGGTSIEGEDGVLRGTIQVNAFNDAGEKRILDVAIAPTLLSVTVAKNPLEDSTGRKKERTAPAEELVERRSE